MFSSFLSGLKNIGFTIQVGKKTFCLETEQNGIKLKASTKIFQKKSLNDQQNCKNGLNDMQIKSESDCRSKFPETSDNSVTI